VPTNKQRRQAAQRRLQRQLERREQLARKRRRNLLIGVTVVAVLAVVAAALIITGLGDDDSDTDVAASASTCSYTPADTSQNANLVDVGTPSGDVPTTGTAAVTMTTNVGDIGLTLDQENAPCAAGSFVYLAQEGFFNDTTCHRETNSETLKVLQCGDPSATGQGGPAYVYPTHVTGSETYPRGTLAMANAGGGTDGSQFFLVYGDSQLDPNYTVLGTIDEAGLAVLDTIAANGIAGGAADGAPAQPVTITAMTVQQ
jgi:peptidyl-prolyl cis-trans isomerase B (cyclophilin B)